MRSQRISARDTQPGRHEGLNLNIGTPESGCRADASPIRGDEGTRDGNRSIVLHKRVKPGQFGERAEDIVRNGSARKIVDEPSNASVRFHPLEEFNNLFVGKVVREEGTDHQVRLLRRRIAEYI